MPCPVIIRDTSSGSRWEQMPISTYRKYVERESKFVVSIRFLPLEVKEPSVRGREDFPTSWLYHISWRDDISGYSLSPLTQEGMSHIQGYFMTQSGHERQLFSAFIKYSSAYQLAKSIIDYSACYLLQKFQMHWYSQGLNATQECKDSRGYFITHFLPYIYLKILATNTFQPKEI